MGFATKHFWHQRHRGFKNCLLVSPLLLFVRLNLGMGQGVGDLYRRSIEHFRWYTSRLSPSLSQVHSALPLSIPTVGHPRSRGTYATPPSPPQPPLPSQRRACTLSRGVPSSVGHTISQPHMFAGGSIVHPPTHHPLPAPPLKKCLLPFCLFSLPGS